jgi:hypothetical protein
MNGGGGDGECFRFTRACFDSGLGGCSSFYRFGFHRCGFTDRGSRGWSGLFRFGGGSGLLRFCGGLRSRLGRCFGGGGFSWCGRWLHWSLGGRFNGGCRLGWCFSRWLGRGFRRRLSRSLFYFRRCFGRSRLFSCRFGGRSRLGRCRFFSGGCFGLAGVAGLAGVLEAGFAGALAGDFTGLSDFPLAVAGVFFLVLLLSAEVAMCCSLAVMGKI